MSTSSQATPTQAVDSNTISPPLSGGAIAGIAVGAMCGLGVIAAILGLAIYRKKRSREPTGITQHDFSYEMNKQSAATLQELPDNEMRHEIDDGQNPKVCHEIL